MFMFKIISFVFRFLFVFRPIVCKIAPNAFKSRVLSASDLRAVSDFFHTWEAYGFDVSLDATDSLHEEFTIYYSTGFDVVNEPLDFLQVYGHNYVLFLKYQIKLYFNADFDMTRLNKVYNDDPWVWEFIGDFSDVHDDSCGGCINCSPKTFI